MVAAWVFRDVVPGAKNPNQEGWRSEDADGLYGVSSLSAPESKGGLICLVGLYGVSLLFRRTLCYNNIHICSSSLFIFRHVRS
jgi:hypothetical protein